MPNPLASELAQEDGAFLIGTAREAIEARLERRAPHWPRPDGSRRAALESPCGAFVTLRSGKGSAAPLRGCIGRMSSDESLVEVVREMAQAAAFEDPRFPALSESEYPLVSVEITVLTPMRPIAGVEEIELGKHGVYLTKGFRQAVFLPQVATEQGWDRTELLENLSLKAGLPPDAWRDEDARFQVFEGMIFEEDEPRGRG